MLQKRAKERIVLLLGGKDSAEYSMHSKDYFHEMWNAFYARFGVTSFWDTLLFDYDDALVWIGEWLPAVKEVQVVPCLLCEEKPGTLDTGEGVICEACAQIMGELA